MGTGLGLRLLLLPRPDGSVALQLLLRRVSLASLLLPTALTHQLVAGDWLPLTLRHDQRGLNLTLGRSTLLRRLALPGFAPLNSWSFAIGACGVAPKQSSSSGGWHVAGLQMRAGASFRYADETLHVSLNGQQLLPANATFRFYAPPRPFALTPLAAPTHGGTRITFRAENLHLAEAIACDFLPTSNGSDATPLPDGPNGPNGSAPNGSASAPAPARNGSLRTLTPALIERVADASDGIGGGSTVSCTTPTPVAEGGALLGVRVVRDGVAYSTHDDPAGSALDFDFYPAIPNATGYSPRLGSAVGGTLVSVALGGAAAQGLPVSAALCRFGDVDVSASLSADRTTARCISPPASAAPTLLWLALNGHDLEPPAGLPFLYVPPPTLLAAVPPGAVPGTWVVLVGRHLGTSDASARYSCRFGLAVVEGTPHPEARVVANRWEADTVSCIVPARPAGSPAMVQLSVSLNGQDFTEEDVRFAFL